MDLLTIALIVSGLVLFETVSSVDNAIINAEVLSSMGEKAKRWFLTWGLLIAVFVVRQITVSNIERIKKYVFLKNGAMYSILFLGIIMLLESFGFHIPAWLTPLVTAVIVVYFFLKSRKALV